MVPILLLFAAMFLMIVTLGLLFLQHLRDHEKEEVEAEAIAQMFLRRINEQIDRRLQGKDD